jgi:hypothetical protein
VSFFLVSGGEERFVLFCCFLEEVRSVLRFASLVAFVVGLSGFVFLLFSIFVTLFGVFRNDVNDSKCAKKFIDPFKYKCEAFMGRFGNNCCVKFVIHKLVWN